MISLKRKDISCFPYGRNEQNVFLLPVSLNQTQCVDFCRYRRTRVGMLLPVGIAESESVCCFLSVSPNQFRFRLLLLTSPKHEWAAACRGRDSARRPSFWPAPVSLPCGQSADSYFPFPLILSTGAGKGQPTGLRPPAGKGPLALCTPFLLPRRIWRCEGEDS